MTQRERQILNWIEADPMISQQELAERAGITRSSVAVHISNLMKKGCIAGKGYIVTRSPYVTVVGGMNMDIGGWPSEELVAQDSNPGRVRMSPGGVGRNIAHNMSLMGLDVRLLTAFGDDVYAQKLAAVCGELGIDISQSPVIPGGHTSTYLFINDQQGDMQLAVSDMDIYRNLTPRVLAGRKQLLEGSQVVVIDTNLPAESIAWLADNCHAPIFADPVSTVKAEKLRPVLGKLHTLKPNRLEAELLSGVPITDTDSLHRAAQTLLETGLHRVFISLGADGVYAADQSGSVTLPAPKAEMVSTTPTGSVCSILALPVKKSQKSPPYSAPEPMALAVSMTLPPPSASRKSAPVRRTRPMPSYTLPLRGLAWTPESSVQGMPAASRAAVTVSRYRGATVSSVRTAFLRCPGRAAR